MSNPIPAQAFIEALTIYNRNSKRLTFFDMNWAQERLLDILNKHNRVIVFKARRLGISTLIRGWQFYNWNFTTAPRTYALMAHTREAAEEIGTMDARFIENLPAQARPKLSKANNSTKRARKSNATLKVFTAGSKGGTRSFEAYMAHLSEAAFYDDLQETLNTVLPTVGSGQVVLESTANVYGDTFHQLVLGSIPEDYNELNPLEDIKPGPNGWVLVFLPWILHPEYQLSPPTSFRLTHDEVQLKDKYNLSNRQLAWRRREIASMGLTAFKREYPLTIDEAFQSSTEYYIDRQALTNIQVKYLGTREARQYVKTFNSRYVLGVDVAEGVGSDFSALSAVDIVTRQPVYHWRSNTIPPWKLAEKIITVSRKLNNPLTIVESNNDGKLVLHKLKEYKYKHLWTDDKNKPFHTNAKTRPLLFGILREAIETNLIEELDKELYEQLYSLVIRNGRPDHPKGGNDDMAVSLALCYYVLKDIPLIGYVNSKVTRFEDFKKKVRVNRIDRRLPFTPAGGWKY